MTKHTKPAPKSRTGPGSGGARPGSGRPEFPPELRKRPVSTKLAPRVILGFRARALANGTSFAREIESAFHATE